ncbi:ArsR family transcriptional regulator [Luteipulveratus mongoliensis]|uniref:ArsR family transcriptional regulator n=2 Tax=Luteipulveratus mongoliensis TaxID=571913 RepID=A0A0K1JQW8_9MICO|nr:helix-turn-helix domain-containing protein [Luteipulveratus mongoliensis]AKU18945.1 ArsR family transcriptional regulator [Luteipulveratus mongoliensis]
MGPRPTGDGSAQPQALETGTRERVKQTVSEHGPITAAELAQRLGLTPAAVRRHLDCLADAGLLEEHEKAPTEARRRGRPARAYVLTEAGHADLREDYDTLAADVLRFLAEHAGPGAVTAYAQQRAREVAERLARDMADAGDDLQSRTEALAAGLRREGYAASMRPVAAGTPLAGLQLCQGHCPVRDVAAQFPQLCEAEAEMFSDLLGVHVQRLASLAHGDHVCTTFVPLPEVRTTKTSPDTSERDPR